jgi:hypothetical protein
MLEMTELLELHNDLRRYTGLHFWLGDAAMREYLNRLIEETRAKIDALEAEKVRIARVPRAS